MVEDIESVEVRVILNGEHAKEYKRLKEGYEKEDGPLSDAAVLRRMIHRAHMKEGLAK